MQVIERAFQIRDGEGIVAIPAAIGNSAQRAAQLHTRRLEFADELIEIFVPWFFQTEFVGLIPEFDGALEATVLERVAQIAGFGADPGSGGFDRNAASRKSSDPFLGFNVIPSGSTISKSAIVVLGSEVRTISEAMRAHHERI